MTHPTGYTALDLVGFTDKGTYASNVAYVKNDIVHYTGSLWRCKIDDTTNVTPGENANWTAFIGEPQSLVERIIAPLEDNPATVAYLTGRQIIYDDWLWEVIDDIAVGDALIDYAVDPTNANIKKAVPVETQLLDVEKKVGDLTGLHTTNKADLVAAVNEAKDALDDLSDDVGTINEIDGKVTKTEVLISNSGDAYNPLNPYKVGDLCIYNNVLYRCTSACSAGSWATNQSCFTQDTLTNADNRLNSDLSNKAEVKSYTISSGTTDVNGNYAISTSYIPATAKVIGVKCSGHKVVPYFTEGGVWALYFLATYSTNPIYVTSNSDHPFTNCTVYYVD